jgi:hypothetical protein
MSPEDRNSKDIRLALASKCSLRLAAHHETEMPFRINSLVASKQNLVGFQRTNETGMCHKINHLVALSRISIFFVQFEQTKSECPLESRGFFGTTQYEPTVAMPHRPFCGLEACGGRFSIAGSEGRKMETGIWKLAACAPRLPGHTPHLSFSSFQFSNRQSAIPGR